MTIDIVLRQPAAATAAARSSRAAVAALRAELRRRGHDRPVDLLRWAARRGPFVDAAAFAGGSGAGGYVASDRGDAATGWWVLPADAGRVERAAVLGDAVAYVAGPDPLDAFTAAEALACGTPVVAVAGTAAAAVVEPGATGVVADDGADLAAAAEAAAALDRWACRRSALDRFSIERAAFDLLAARPRRSPPSGTAGHRSTPRPVPTAA